jgi:hypothetical protein
VYEVTMPGSVDAVTIDPDDWVLHEATETQVSSVPTLTVRPNPFNPFTGSTTVSFVTNQATNIEISIYDVAGARVRVLEDRTVSAGFHQFPWDGTNGAGESVATGVYFIRLRLPSTDIVTRAVLLK